MSHNSNTNTSGNNNNTSGINSQGLFTNFLDNSNNNNTSNMNMSRQGTPTSSSPSPQHPSNQVNGASGMPGVGMGMNMNMPMNAGHQMDLNHLYEMVLELSDVLKNNRDMTKGIINSAEEIMVSVIIIYLLSVFLSLFLWYHCLM